MLVPRLRALSPGRRFPYSMLPVLRPRVLRTSVPVFPLRMSAAAEAAEAFMVVAEEEVVSTAAAVVDIANKYQRDR